MVNKLIDNIKKIDKSIAKVMMKGFRFSAYICILSLIILFTYNTYPISHISLDSGLILFRTGLFFAVGFFICGFVVDGIKKELNN